MANPIGQRFADLVRSRNAFVAVAWVLALVAAAILYLRTPEFAGVPGVVEVVDYNVAAPETLRVVAVPVQVGTPVHRGDILAVLDPVPLTLERDLVRAELELRTTEVRFRQMTDERSFAQAVAGAQEARLRESMDAKRVEADLSAVRKRLAWWKAQVAAGTAPGLEVADLTTEAAALSQRLQAHRDAIAALTAQEKEGRERLAAYRGVTGKATGASGGGEADAARSAVRVAEAHLALLESRLAALTLRAPADGVVQKVDARPGDVSQAGQTVVLVREDIPRRVFAYPSASQATLLRIGTPAFVAARDAGGTARFPAHVVAIGPGLVPYPDALQNRTGSMASFGQAVILRLDGPSPLAPGQVVDVSLLRVGTPLLRDPGSPDGTSLSPVPAAEARPADPAPAAACEATAPALLTVPETLSRVSRLEPSGLLFLPERDRYLVVSDDTGLPERDDHAPWVFLMDREGRFDPSPTVLEGAPEVSDLESAARTADGRIWLLSSQSVSRKGRRPDSRTLLLRVDLRDGRLSTSGTASLANALLALPPARLDALGLSRRDETLVRDGFDRILNVEGMTADRDALIVGLKQPQDEAGHAIVWRISNPAHLVDTGRFADGDPVPIARLDLPLGDGPTRGHAGISDLALLPDGGLAVLGTALPDSGLGDRGAFYVVPGPLSQGPWQARKVREFPGLKPEGVAVGPVAGEVTIVFDEKDKVPHWVRVPLPR